MCSHCHKHVWTFAGSDVFEAAPGVPVFAIFRPDHGVLFVLVLHGNDISVFHPVSGITRIRRATVFCWPGSERLKDGVVVVTLHVGIGIRIHSVRTGIQIHFERVAISNH